MTTAPCSSLTPSDRVAVSAHDAKRAYLDADADDRVATDVDTGSKAGGGADQGAPADDDIGRDPGIVGNQSGGVNARAIGTRTRTGSTGTVRGGRDNGRLHAENANRKCCPEADTSPHRPSFEDQRMGWRPGFGGALRIAGSRMVAPPPCETGRKLLDS